MARRDFLVQWQGYGLTTAEIHYRLPDYPALLLLYVWQDYDLAPAFPTLQGFLEYWRRELEGALHSVRVAHQRLIKPSEWRAVDGFIQIHGRSRRGRPQALRSFSRRLEARQSPSTP